MQQRELEGYISRVTLEEMEKAPTHTFLRLQRVVRQARLKVVAASDESNAIAQLYIDGGIIPSNYDNDARHIAVAVVNHIPVIASYNPRHIVRAEVMTGVNEVNMEQGYPPIVICTPEALV